MSPLTFNAIRTKLFFLSKFRSTLTYPILLLYTQTQQQDISKSHLFLIWFYSLINNSLILQILLLETRVSADGTQSYKTQPLLSSIIVLSGEKRQVNQGLSDEVKSATEGQGKGLEEDAEGRRSSQRRNTHQNLDEKGAQVLSEQECPSELGWERGAGSFRGGMPVRAWVREGCRSSQSRDACQSLGERGAQVLSEEWCLSELGWMNGRKWSGVWCNRATEKTTLPKSKGPGGKCSLGTCESLTLALGHWSSGVAG